MGFEASSLMFAAGSFVVFLVIWLALRLTRRFGLSTMYLWMLPMMATGVALSGLALPVAGGSAGAALFVPTFLCLSAVNIGFEIMVKLLSVHMAMRNPAHAWRLVSFGTMIPSIGGLVSSAILSSLQSQGGAGCFYQIMLAAMAVFVTAVSVALGSLDSAPRRVILIGQGSFGAGGAASSIVVSPVGASSANAEDLEEGDSSCSKADSVRCAPGAPSACTYGLNQAESPGATNDVAQRCAQVASRFGLSARELDVLVLLAQGRSRTYIRETLFISKGTVDTHIHRIYVKMGIGSKDELLALVLDETPH